MIITRRITHDTHEYWNDIDLGQISTVKSTGEIVLHDRDGYHNILLSPSEADRIVRQVAAQRENWKRWNCGQSKPKLRQKKW